MIHFIAAVVFQIIDILLLFVLLLLSPTTVVREDRTGTFCLAFELDFGFVAIRTMPDDALGAWGR